MTADEIVKLILEITRGSLKINSSIIGRSNKTLNIVVGLNSISWREGNKLKNLSGAEINNPVNISIITIMRNDFQTSLKKTGNDIISNCFSGMGFFRNLIISLKSIILIIKSTNKIID